MSELETTIKGLVAEQYPSFEFVSISYGKDNKRCYVHFNDNGQSPPKVVVASFTVTNNATDSIVILCEESTGNLITSMEFQKIDANLMCVSTFLSFREKNKPKIDYRRFDFVFANGKKIRIAREVGTGNFSIENYSKIPSRIADEAELTQLKLELEKALKKNAQSDIEENFYQMYMLILRQIEGIQNVPGMLFKFSPYIYSVEELNDCLNSVSNRLNGNQLAIVPVMAAQLQIPPCLTPHPSLSLEPKTTISHATNFFILYQGQKYLIDSSLVDFFYLFEPDKRLKKNIFKNITLCEPQQGVANGEEGPKKLMDLYSIQKGNTCRYWSLFFNLEVSKCIANNQGENPIQVLNKNFDEILLKTASGVSALLDERPAILFERLTSLEKFFYQDYQYKVGNENKTVFLLREKEVITERPQRRIIQESRCIRLSRLKNMLKIKYEQKESLEITSTSQRKKANVECCY